MALSWMLEIEMIALAWHHVAFYGVFSPDSHPRSRHFLHRNKPSLQFPASLEVAQHPRRLGDPGIGAASCSTARPHGSCLR